MEDQCHFGKHENGDQIGNNGDQIEVNEDESGTNDDEMGIEKSGFQGLPANFEGRALSIHESAKEGSNFTISRV